MSADTARCLACEHDRQAVNKFGVCNRCVQGAMRKIASELRLEDAAKPYRPLPLSAPKDEPDGWHELNCTCVCCYRDTYPRPTFMGYCQQCLLEAM